MLDRTEEIQRFFSEVAGLAAQRKAASVYVANVWAWQQGLGMVEWSGYCPSLKFHSPFQNSGSLRIS
jgi:hypothetical protein